MKARTAVIVGLAGGLAGQAQSQNDRPQLQRLSNAIEVTPLRVAKVLYENGQARVVSDWSDYNGGAARGADTRVFDCFGDDNSDGYMDDTNGCMSNSISRWFFGTGFCNPFVSADHTVWDQANLDAGFGRVDLAWQWTCVGFGVESCLMAVLTQDSVPCEPDSFDYSGWVFDFGTLSCNPGGYYYSNIELSSGTWPIPTGGNGSHILLFGQSLTDSGGVTFATCAQPMLWGTGDAGGASNTMRGTQITEQFDDDIDFNGSHASSECYTYSFGLCPDPLGAMVQFWSKLTGGGVCELADFNLDGRVNSRDFLAFLNAWNASDPRADCTADGTLNTQDVLCFLAEWNACR